MNTNEIKVGMSVSADVEEPEVHSTPVNRPKEFSLTESAIDDSSTQSTPTSAKCSSQINNDIMSILRTISRDINEQKSDSDVKFNKINSKFDGQKNEINTRCNSMKEQIIESISNLSLIHISSQNKLLKYLRPG